MKPNTKLTQLGRTAVNTPGTVNVPMHRASTVLFDSVADLHDTQTRWMKDEQIPTYAIFNMPQALALENAVAEIEGGYRAVTYPSGLAAVAGALLACVKSGDNVLVPDSVYGPGRHFCDSFLTRMGVSTTYYDPLIGSGMAALLQPNTTVVYTESPGSHTFEVQDIPAIARVAHAHGAKVILDNAWATGYFFNAFARLRFGGAARNQVLRRPFGCADRAGDCERRMLANAEVCHARSRSARLARRLLFDLARYAHHGRAAQTASAIGAAGRQLDAVAASGKAGALPSVVV